MPIPRAALLLGDWLAFSSLLPAAVAAALLVAASVGLGLQPDWLLAGLAASGTLVVYNVDRLRDTAADERSAPRRTAFVEQHRRALWGSTCAALAVALALAARSSLGVQLLCAAVLVLGLLHRRIKRRPLPKPIYVGAAWLAVTVGIPALGARDASALPWVTAVVAAALAANLVATSLRGEVPTDRDQWKRRLWAARAAAVLGLAIGLAGPPAARALTAIPALELLALAGFRANERFGLVILDGALLLGAVLALVAGPLCGADAR